MKAFELRLKDFRNIAELGMRLADGANIICGDNGQGKTNILEAVWLFTGAKSFRGGRDADYIRFGNDRCLLELAFEAGDRPQNACISIGRGSKDVSLNEISLTGASKLAGEFCSVLFSPDHLPLVKQGPEHRRNMMDASLCQAYPKYGAILESYRRILRQRAGLLRDIPKNPSLSELLEVWDKALLDYGSYITAARIGYIKRLALHAADIYTGISGGREGLELSYRLSGGSTDASTRQELREYLAGAVNAARREDIAAGRTTVGPHRDDLDIKIGGVSARSFGSQGQQRSAVLALKLAECALLEERSGDAPVVLLDDVMSELDAHRRAYILNKLVGKQIIITCCDAGLFSSLEGGRVFTLSNGKVISD